MQIRTDLALEQQELCGQNQNGIKSENYHKNGITVDKITVLNKAGEQALNKPMGTYVTLQLPPFSKTIPTQKQIDTVVEELTPFLPQTGLIFVAGLGNTVITPDALGPKTACQIFATRHIETELAKAAGLESLRPVAVIAPGVLGQTGIETAEIVKSIAKKVQPAAVLAIDALASRKLERLGCTVQISNAGIEPGAGVGNARNELSQKTLGVPVIALGVPTVVEATTLIYDLTGTVAPAEPDGRKMIVTPREIDLIIERASKFLANCLNAALQPQLSREVIQEMLS